jgi:hypothetical protein
MDVNLEDFTKRKIVFLDWLYVYAGYGSRLTSRPNVKETQDCVPVGVELKVFPPEMSQTKIFKPEKPWEMGYMGAYNTLVKEEDYYRFYYEIFLIENGKISDYKSILCYAELKNGKWIRPSLDIVPWKEQKLTNIIFSPEMHWAKQGLHGANVYKDPHALDKERYKLTYCGPHNLTYACYSSDGLHWTPVKKPIINAEADSQNEIYWDEQKKKYIGYFRVWRKERRGISYCESEDFWNWPDPEIILHADPNLPVDADFYTNGFHIWPGTEPSHDAFVMFPSMYHRISDHVDTELFVSRNGKNWFRPNQNPITFPKTPNNPKEGAMYFGNGIYSDSPGIWKLISAWYPFNHNRGETNVPGTGGFYSAAFREDGFIGLRAEGAGEFWTIKFTTKSPTIKINAQTGDHGWIEIGLYDVSRRTDIEEITVKDCDLLNGNLLGKRVSWHNQSNISDYGDVVLRLHVKMFQANIFAIQFE